MTVEQLSRYWEEIPIGRENAVSYFELCVKWGIAERQVRNILHDLSLFDNSDNFVLIRSARTKGFYRSDDIDEIQAYRRECLSKGKSIFAPVKKCNRILHDYGQIDLIINAFFDLLDN